ncbi:hypothetical protein [Bradyrhizobium cosmicum]|uniref:phage fiber-tail adaptor protein n=1 Tax=Bradyrhizobium cosmicum TaxID=1404864 RepID=UPI0011636241|nr:hypothetical protein [Bradyrhizobium cosmicum]QDP20668.1 hypothetical protein FNV92_00215 [Bradyrhizobium cosmicum]
MKTWPAKDPDEILDYDLDWTMRLYSADELALVAPDLLGLVPTSELVPQPADTIASSSFTLPSGTLVANSSSYTSTHTKVWLAGGAEGESYLVQNRITTAGGRTMDQTVKLKVKSK